MPGVGQNVNCEESFIPGLGWMISILNVEWWGLTIPHIVWRKRVHSREDGMHYRHAIMYLGEVAARSRVSRCLFRWNVMKDIAEYGGVDVDRRSCYLLK